MRGTVSGVAIATDAVPTVLVAAAVISRRSVGILSLSALVVIYLFAWMLI